MNKAFHIQTYASIFIRRERECAVLCAPFIHYDCMFLFIKGKKPNKRYTHSEQHHKSKMCNTRPRNGEIRYTKKKSPE